MRLRTRKLIGIAATVLFLIVYCLIAMAIGGAHFVDVPGLAQFAYFVLAGVLWLPAVMLIVRWMSRPDAQP